MDDLSNLFSWSMKCRKSVIFLSSLCIAISGFPACTEPATEHCTRQRCYIFSVTEHDGRGCNPWRIWILQWLSDEEQGVFPCTAIGLLPTPLQGHSTPSLTKARVFSIQRPLSSCNGLVNSLNPVREFYGNVLGSEHSWQKMWVLMSITIFKKFLHIS